VSVNGITLNRPENAFAAFHYLSGYFNDNQRNSRTDRLKGSRVRALFKGHKKSVITLLLFVAYAGVVFWSNYYSQQRLQQNAQSQFYLDTERQAAAISYYFSERRNDITELAESEGVLNFFRNRDLGMSLRYGLGISVQALEDRFERIAARKQLGDQPAYAGLMLVDSDGVQIATWNRLPTDRGDLQEWLAPNNRETRIFFNKKKSELVVAAPVWISNAYRGELLAWVDIGTSLAQFGKDYSDWWVLFVDRSDGTPLNIGRGTLNLSTKFDGQFEGLLARPDLTSVELRGRNGDAFTLAKVAIEQTPLAFVSIGTQHSDSQNATRLFLIAVGVVPLIVLLVAIMDMRDRRRLEIQRENAKLEAERLAQVRSNFLANMSHEIRTPLNGILGLARIGLRQNQGNQADRTFSRIFESGQHLLGVINDILEFSKIEAGKLKVETQPFALRAVIDNVLNIIEERAASKGLGLSITLAPSLPDLVSGDALRLTQILANLFSNAIKFTEKGEVSLCVANDGNDIHFLITDSGIGMSEAQLSRLFQPFEQADSSTTRKFGGTGLGLVISRNLAHLMGGEISVYSQPDAGASFILQLPLAAAAANTAYPQPSSVIAHASRLSGLSVLAVEDIEVNRFILQDLLAQEGAHSVFASNGKEALAQLEKSGAGSFNVVLMDVQMPIMDGYEATRRIAEIAPGLPVIGLTAHALQEEREKCFAAGMVAHVTKPIDPDMLVSVILSHVQNVVSLALPPSELPAAPAMAPTKMAISALLPDAADQIDRVALLNRFKGKRETLKRLADLALAGNLDLVAKLRLSAQERDWKTFAFLVHGVKGVSGNLEAAHLHAMAKSIELDLNKELDISAEQLETFLHAIEAFMAELRRISVEYQT
jgi:signal transduction histidine kinase/CheY-like chemotaxis protein/HPt (histidine-containing phosphotransfer) domain-containing protein